MSHSCKNKKHVSLNYFFQEQVQVVKLQRNMGQLLERKSELVLSKEAESWLQEGRGGPSRGTDNVLFLDLGGGYMDAAL